MNLTGEEDQLGLLMNADFQELMQNVEVLSKNLLQMCIRDRRIAMMDRTSPDVIKEVERVLERKLSSLLNQDYTCLLYTSRCV